LIQLIDRAIRILFALQGERRLGIAELASRLELPPSTVHGIVESLAAYGFVAQDPSSGRYQLGHAVLRLGNVYLDTLELRARAVPCVRPSEAARILGGELRSITGDTITDPDELRAQFDDVAKNALADENDEVVLGESSVGAPIFDTRGIAVGAIAVVLPTTDWPVDENVRDALREAARNISRELGAQRWPVHPERT
jgi:DNA-binding IclR family transcriptional regulator